MYNYNGVIYSEKRMSLEDEPIFLSEAFSEDDCLTNEYSGTNHLDLCLVAEKDGKLGVMLRCPERPSYGDALFKCMEEDFKYDTIKVFYCEKCGNVITIGNCLGEYQCFLIEKTADITDNNLAFEAKSSLLFTSPIYKDCLEHIPEFEEYILHLSASADNVERLAKDQIFVFESNREGEHRSGVSKIAMSQFGALWGIGKGRVGQSYALPTMDGDLHILGHEIQDFMSYAESHPELEFVLTNIGGGASIWQEEEVGPIFALYGYTNILKPLGWNRFVNNDDFEPSVGVSIAGRHTFDEWIGNLAVMYANHKNIDLGFSKEGITILSENADDLCRDLVTRFNIRRDGMVQIQELCDLYNTDLQYFGDDLWYARFLEYGVLELCSDFEIGSTLNPSESICELVNYIVKNHPVTCSKIYNPFAGIGALSYRNNGYTNQEPSFDYSLMSRLLVDMRHSDNKCVTGNFNTDWLAEGHDAIVCIPPITYFNVFPDIVCNNITPQYRQTLKLFMHKLTQPCESLKLAVVFVNDDFLYADDFERYRRIFCKDLGILKYVIMFSSSTFTDMKTGGAILVFDYCQCSHSVNFITKDFIDCFGPDVDDELNPVYDPKLFDWSRYEFTVPCSTLAENHYILIDESYESFRK